MKLGPTELIVILIIVIVLFGPTQIPKLTKMSGKSVKDGMAEEEEGKDKEAKSEDGKE